MTPLEYARRFAASGVRVHPVWWIDRDVDESGRPEDSCACGEADCRSVAKHPIVSTSVSSTDLAQIESWWREYPSANLGVNTDGLTVVDVDFRHGGMESYRELQPNLPQTLRVKTGNGFHEYYRGVVDKAGGKLAPGIDFKSGPAQQVVGPGSEHMNGSEYELTSGGTAIAPLPSRVRELVEKRRSEPSEVAPVRDELIQRGEGNDALVAAAAFFANHSRTLEELIGHVAATAMSMVEPPTPERVREIAEHRWKNHDQTYVDPTLGAALMHVDEDGNYVFDATDALDSIYDGTYRPPCATILPHPGKPEQGLFYPKSINLVFGEDSIGKTWVSLSAAQFVLARGGRVVHLDWDDSYETCAYRLKLLSVRRDEMERYHHRTSPADIRTAAGAILARGADLIIVDVVANALAAADLSEDKAGDYLKWAADTAIPWARAGACVILNDHVTKGQGHQAYARGSGAKRGGVDGVAYEVSANEMILPGEGGSLRLRIAKDRHGSVGGRGVDIADLNYAADMALDVVAPPEDEEEAHDHIAALRMSLYRERLEVGFSRRDVERLRDVSQTAAQRTLDRMLEERHCIVAEPGGGPVPRTYNLLPPPTEGAN